jgi:hypothetical protein
VTSGAHDIPPADEPHANRNSRVPQVRLPQGRVFHAHALRRWRHPSSQLCLEERIVQRVPYAEHGGLAIFKCRATDKSNPLYVNPALVVPSRKEAIPLGRTCVLLG